MLEPYADHTQSTGSLLVNASTIVSLATDWALAGFQVNIHAIGDRANRVAVDALTTALAAVCPHTSPSDCQAARRFRIEHAQIIYPTDQARILDVGIIPSVQPTHATTDMYYAAARLGPWRTANEAYRMRSLLAATPAGPVLGSDFPVEPADPFQGMYAAVTRRSPHTGLGPEGEKEGWHTGEALSREQALMGFTRGPAAAAFLEDKAGVIKKGAFADWVVLDKPLDEYDIEELRRMKVRETWVKGRRVYEAEKKTAGGEDTVGRGWLILQNIGSTFGLR